MRPESASEPTVNVPKQIEVDGPEQIDLRLVPAAGAAWGCALLLAGMPAARPLVCAIAWLAAVIALLLVLRGRERRGRGRRRRGRERRGRESRRCRRPGRGQERHRWVRRVVPAVALAAAAVGLVAASAAGQGQSRHPAALDQLAGRVGVAVLTITGTPRETSAAPFGIPPDADDRGASDVPRRVQVEARLDAFSAPVVLAAGSAASRPVRVRVEASSPVLLFTTIDRAPTDSDRETASPRETGSGGEEAPATEGVSLREAASIPETGPAGDGVPVREGASLREAASLREGASAGEGAPVSQGFSIGERVEVTGVLRGLEAGESHEFLLFGRGEPWHVAGAPWWVGWAGAVRDSFRAATAALPGDGAELLTGLAIGDDSRVSDALREAMTVTGLTHLTAVSGANCAVVVAAVMLVGGAVGLGRRIRVAVAVGVLVLFVVLVTPEPSVLRAAVMAVIVLVALAAGRPAAGLPALALSVIVLLVIDPWLGRSAGFTLSVLATAGLLTLTRPLAALAERILPRWAALAVSVPTAAQLACQPVLLLLSPQLTPYTVPANLLAEPAAAAVSVLGLVVCLLAVAAPPVAAAAAWLPWIPSAWIAAVARYFAAAPFAAIDVPDSVVAAALAAVLGAALAVALALAARRPRAARRLAAAAALAVLVLGGALAGGVIARSRAVPADWQLAACDIGQGDAVLLRSAGRIALIDVGPDPDPLSACLTRLGIARLDLLVLTHFDRDHVGGLDAVLGRVDRALVGLPDGAADERLLAALRDHGTDVVTAERGMSGMLGRDRWEVLWPRAHASLRGNDASVTLLISGALRMLFLGDLGERAQQAVTAANPLPVVDVVKVSHHGSADQSERLYRTVRARIGVISVGEGNSYGHPTDRLLALLARVGTHPFRTDRSGLVVVAGTTAAPVVWTERPVASGPTASASASASGVTDRLGEPVRSAHRAGRRARGGHGGRTRQRRGGEERRREGERQGRHSAARVEPDPPRSRRSRHRPRDLPRRARDPPPARPAQDRGPEPRDHRCRRRVVRAGRAHLVGQPLAVRRTPPDPGELGREVHRRVHRGGDRLPRVPGR